MNLKKRWPYYIRRMFKFIKMNLKDAIDHAHFDEEVIPGIKKDYIVMNAPGKKIYENFMEDKFAKLLSFQLRPEDFFVFSDFIFTKIKMLRSEHCTDNDHSNAIKHYKYSGITLFNGTLYGLAGGFYTYIPFDRYYRRDYEFYHKAVDFDENKIMLGVKGLIYLVEENECYRAKKSFKPYDINTNVYDYDTFELDEFIYFGEYYINVRNILIIDPLCDLATYSYNSLYDNMFKTGEKVKEGRIYMIVPDKTAGAVFGGKWIYYVEEATEKEAWNFFGNLYKSDKTGFFNHIFNHGRNFWHRSQYVEEFIEMFVKLYIENFGDVPQTYHTSDEPGEYNSTLIASDRVKKDLKKTVEKKSIFRDDIVIKNGFITIANTDEIKVIDEAVFTRCGNLMGEQDAESNTMNHYALLMNFCHEFKYFLNKYDAVIAGSACAFMINPRIAPPNDIDIWMKIENPMQDLSSMGWRTRSEYYPRSNRISPDIYRVSTYHKKDFPLRIQIIETFISPKLIVDQFDLSVSKAIWSPKIYDGNKTTNFRENPVEVIRDIQSAECTFLERDWDITLSEKDKTPILTFRSIKRIIKYLEKGFKIRISEKSIFNIEQIKNMLNGSVFPKDYDKYDMSGFYSLELIDENASTLYRNIDLLMRCHIEELEEVPHRSELFLGEEPIINRSMKKIKKTYRIVNMSIFQYEMIRILRESHIFNTKFCFERLVIGKSKPKKIETNDIEIAFDIQFE